MEALRVLEEKIARLIQSKKQDLEIIAEYYKDLVMFQEENRRLSEEINRLQEALLLYNRENKKIIDESLETTKVVVNELIQSIDMVLKENASL